MACLQSTFMISYVNLPLLPPRYLHSKDRFDLFVPQGHESFCSMRALAIVGPSSRNNLSYKFFTEIFAGGDTFCFLRVVSLGALLNTVVPAGGALRMV